VTHANPPWRHGSVQSCRSKENSSISQITNFRHSFRTDIILAACSNYIKASQQPGRPREAWNRNAPSHSSCFPDQTRLRYRLLLDPAFAYARPAVGKRVWIAILPIYIACTQSRSIDSVGTTSNQTLTWHAKFLERSFLPTYLPWPWHEQGFAPCP